MVVPQSNTDVKRKGDPCESPLFSAGNFLRDRDGEPRAQRVTR